MVVATGQKRISEEMAFPCIPERQRVVAVTGQPNTGKSTLFNRLTGMRQRVGNWPGKTVDRKTGNAKLGTTVYRMVDLPGAYSLTPASAEEAITRDYLLSREADVVVLVANAAALARTLYLAAELIPLGIPMVLALNMMDVAEAEGRPVDAKKLEKVIGIPVVPMAASRNRGVRQLLECMEVLTDQPMLSEQPDNLPLVVKTVERLIAPSLGTVLPQCWAAIKLVEGDKEILERVKALLPEAESRRLMTVLETEEHGPLALVEARRRWIDCACAAALPDIRAAADRTRMWDGLLLHPLWGRLVAFFFIPLLMASGVALGAMTGGTLIKAALLQLPALKAAWPGLLGSLVADGILMGIGWVAALSVFIAIIYAIFFFLEDVGYLARISVLADGPLRRVGASGRAAIPMVLGLMCNAVAVAGTRVVETRRQRMVTSIMLPFFPCLGQTIVAAVFVMAFFPPRTAGWIVCGLTLANVAVAFLAGGVASRFMEKRGEDAMILELPLYHRPHFPTILANLKDRVQAFVSRSGKVILAAMILVWALTWLPNGDMETGFLYRIGQYLEPAGQMIGLDWRFLVALMSSFIAKETTVGTLSVLFATPDASQGAVSTAIAGSVSPAGALAFVVASHFFIPCVSTVGIFKAETGSWKLTGILVAVMFVLALVLAAAAFRIGEFFL
ncbi:ferrous iron transport protein B [Desulfobotulus sp. H1]|uniref:Ferrous iron transport protein B n=1 Tax=Desulfobotulus pelophilus TaxID=2823377 RepID=A0ABT3N7N8_9BACT|nr:ferrous iron transport protein B [Desulfobotulus pelophilus]MCW7753471.1 ferrous iron transport protein B [Desulfobotulus pelophilus]